MNIEQRLQKLERQEQAQVMVPTIVVIYDPVTDQPLTPVDPRAARQIWIPDNGRGDVLAQANRR